MLQTLLPILVGHLNEECEHNKAAVLGHEQVQRRNVAPGGEGAADENSAASQDDDDSDLSDAW